MKFLLGRKIGMTRVYTEEGQICPVTVIQVGPCVVTQVKTTETDGYAALQVGFGMRKHATKAIAGHLAKADQKSAAKITEYRVHDVAELADLAPGKVLDVSVFELGDKVNVSALSKGKGFQGVIKRHGFAGGPETHGSSFHRAPGAIGGRWPQRVVKGKRMAGQMGHTRVTVKGLSIIKIDAENSLLAVSGAIPGPRRGIVEIRG